MLHRYMTNTYELLSNSSQTLQDAGLYNGQVNGVCNVANFYVIALIGHSIGIKEGRW